VVQIGRSEPTIVPAPKVMDTTATQVVAR
jgi:hypothetical protein